MQFSSLTHFGQGKVEKVIFMQFVILSLYRTYLRFKREAFQRPRNYYCELLAGNATQAGIPELSKTDRLEDRTDVFEARKKYLIQNCRKSIELNATHNYCQENFLAGLSSKNLTRAISYDSYSVTR